MVSLKGSEEVLSHTISDVTVNLVLTKKNYMILLQMICSED